MTPPVVSIPDRLAAKLAQGETVRGELLNTITAIGLIQDELADALATETGRREAVMSASQHLDGVTCALWRVANRLEGK